MRKYVQDNKELNRRVTELTKIRQNQKDKISQMEKKQEILLENTNGHKVGQILGYVDKQRNIYRSNVKQLLNKLDPERRTLEELENYDDDVIKMIQTGPSSKETLNVISKNDKLPQVKVTKEYYPEDYQNGTKNNIFPKDSEFEQIRMEKLNLEVKYKTENQELQLKINGLENDLAKLQIANDEMQRKMNQNLGQIRNENQENQEKYSQNVTSFSREIQDMKKELKEKTAFLRELVNDKDVLHQELDDKTLRIEELKKRLLAAENKRVSVETESQGSFRKIDDCLAEIANLQTRLKQQTSKLDQTQTKLSGEQEVSRELRLENAKLKAELNDLQSSSDSQKAKIEDLRSHIQRYVTEVKRIEEILALRERERKELLDQYQHLNDEAETSMTISRRMEVKVTNLEDEIKSRDEEIRLTELRLSHLQEELVEMSQTNEEYRSRIANLSTQIDIKETENRRLKVQESWLGPDLQEIQKLNDQLAEQKQELQSLIAQQAEEIEELNVQIQELRAEIDRLNRNLDEEKRAKQRTFQDQL